MSCDLWSDFNATHSPGSAREELDLAIARSWFLSPHNSIQYDSFEFPLLSLKSNQSYIYIARQPLKRRRHLMSSKTCTAKFFWAAQTKKGITYKLMKLHTSSCNSLGNLLGNLIGNLLGGNLGQPLATLNNNRGTFGNLGIGRISTCPQADTQTHRNLEL